MTTTALILIVAACVVLACVIPLLTYAWWPRPRHREPADRAERPRAGAVRAAAALRARLRSLWLVPRRDDVAAFTGATEAFGAELRALKDAPVASELVTDVETEARWAGIWHDFEQKYRGELGGICDRARAALMKPLPAATCMILESASWPTGQFSDAEVAELHALLAADRELVSA